VMKRTRKTAVTGVSRLLLGTPPRPAVVGGYGGPAGCGAAVNIRF
jgi:hypothetical protein